MRRSRFMRMLLLTALAVASAAGCASAPPAPGPATPWSPLQLTAEDKKIAVAKVNDTVITRYMLMDMMNRLSVLDQRTASTPTASPSRKRALDQLILNELALQQAARQGIRVDDAVTDRAMEQIVDRLGHDGFRNFLARQQQSLSEFRGEIERNLLVQQMLNREVVAKTPVSEDEIKREYERIAAAENRRSYEEEKPAIETRLRLDAQARRRQEWERELKQGAKIELYDAADRQEQNKRQP